MISQRHDTDDAELHDVVFSYALEDEEGTTITGIINEGESYFQADDTWYDLSEEKEFFIDNIYNGYISAWGEEDFLDTVPRGKEGIAFDNFPIKAYLVPARIHDVEYILGDADLDNEVSVTDATTVQRYDAEVIDLDYVAFTLADVDRDHDVSIVDATWIQRYLADMKAPDGIGETILS